MRIGVFAKTFPGSEPAGVLAQAATAGFEGVQYNMACSGLAAMPDEISDAVTRAVAEAAVKTGQQIFAVSGTYNMIHPNPAVRRAGERRLEVIAAACRKIGTSLVTLCTGTRDAEDQWRHHPDNGSAEAWRDLLSSFEVAIAIASRHDLQLGIEPELANVVNSAEAARRLINEMKSDRLRIVLDPANLAEEAEDSKRRRIIAQAVDVLGDRIAMAHAKDRAADGRVATAGKGVVDFRHFLAALNAAGFDGPLVAHGFDAAEAAGVSAFLRTQRSLL
jgi:sugar phosphate isomerase/epimerase